MLIEKLEIDEDEDYEEQYKTEVIDLVERESTI
jgi:hypothetical protein